MEQRIGLSKGTYAGLYMVALATLTYEILLTRIFSVTMWYHFAFVAVSVAMFGMTAGALAVFLYPRYFTAERAHTHMAASGLLFAISIVASFMTHLSIPFVMPKTVVGLYSMALTYIDVSIPFVFSGICVCLALTRFPERTNALYAFDLAGAATGCLVVVLVLGAFDGPSAVFLTAGLASLGSACFAGGAGLRRMRSAAILCFVLLAGAAATNAYLASKQSAPLRLLWVKGSAEKDTLYETWNSFSRIHVSGDPTVPKRPWGISPQCPSEPRVEILMLAIDATADTPLTSFKGDFREVEYFKCTSTSMVYALKPDSKALIVGAGGGRDILSALVYGQSSVTAVEINPQIVAAVNQTFGDFTGHLNNNPRVHYVTDEARSYLARTKDLHDVIQISFIDTWAATSAGAFVLSENSLYTTEAWKIFLARLRPGGILSVSRWYFRDRPAEMYRLASLAAASLREAGVQDPSRHLIIVRQLLKEQEGVEGIGTLLASRDPFTEGDVAVVREFTQKLGFDLVFSPAGAADPAFAAIASRDGFKSFSEAYPLDISAPTDDRPFFFQMLRFSQIFNRELQRQGSQSPNLHAVAILGGLLITVSGLTILTIVVPLVLAMGKMSLHGARPLAIYFASIGLGFMLVEISQMQRLIVFLGHPTYGLTVVLFTLLLAAGAGSFSTARKEDSGDLGGDSKRLIGLLGVLALFGLFGPTLADLARQETTPVRILVAAALLVPPGFFMGMAFPIGMRVASRRSPELTPWLWGINGAMSVLASVIAVVISMGAGISASFWTGFAAYALGVGMLFLKGSASPDAAA